MAREHKKLYKAGKNWIVATLTATTITLLGGIGAYTAHADTTAENNQSTETSNISQSSQSDNSSNSVVLTQPVTTQSNQTALSNQSEQSTPTNQATSTAATNITTTNSFNKVTPNNYGAVNESNNLLLTQKKTNDSSLRYTPSVSGFEGDVEKSGLGEVDRKISDPVYPNITVYYSFFHSTDKPEIQQYAHKGVTRDIYIKDPQTGVESLDRHDLVIFNRWVAVDTTRNNQLVGLGPWVLSLTSPKSFPKYNIPQKNGYTSYCNGKKTTMIDEEQVSSNQPGEIYHITYVSDSSIIAKKTRTIIINYPNGEQKNTFVQNAELDGSTYSWPEYIIPGEVGYDSYVDGHKATSISTQTVHVYDNDNVIVNVTYRRPVSDTHKTITRTIYIHDIDGNVSTIPQAVVYTRYANSDTQGNIVSYTNWVADGNSSWNEYAIPQHEGFISQIGSEDTKVVPSQLVNPNDADTIVNVTYKKTPVTPSKDKHKAITRTIKIAYPSGYVQTIYQTVNYTYHTVKIGSEVLAGWVADGNDSWDKYAIPQHDGFISQVDSQDAKIVPSQHVTSNDKNVIVNVTYKQAPATSTSKQHKTITRTISLHDINGNILNTIQQKVNYTRNVITDTEGNTVSHTDWIANGNDSWNEYTIPQHEGYKSQVNSQDAKVVSSHEVKPDDNDVNVSITYVKTGSDVDHNEHPAQPSNPTTPVNPTTPTTPVAPATKGNQGANQPSDNNVTGWRISSDGNHYVYYKYNQPLAGRRYVSLPTINGVGTSWYLVDNGVVQSGVQKWAGTYYYFNPQNYLRVDNDYVQSQWGDWYLFGNDGRILTGVQKWAGSYYYFDPVTYLKVTNSYRQSQWGDWYMFGPDGRIVSGLYNWLGNLYYFDPVTYLKVTNQYVYVGGVRYWADANGCLSRA